MRHSRRAAGLAAFIVTTVLTASAASARPHPDQPLYKDPNAPLEQRVEDLLSRMTLEEIGRASCRERVFNWV